MNRRHRRARALAEVLMGELGYLAAADSRPDEEAQCEVRPSHRLLEQELRRLLDRHPDLKKAPKSRQASRPATSSAAQERLEQVLLANGEQADTLWFLVQAGGLETPHAESREESPGHRVRVAMIGGLAWSTSILLYMVAMVLAAAAYWWLWGHPSARVPALQVTAFLVLASLPGWMYIRFLRVKERPLREEYILNLHRLGVDKRAFLPEPPVSSIYYEAWCAAGGPRHRPEQNIYLEKFQAYYGRRTRDWTHGQLGVISSGGLLPVALAGVVFTAGWLSIIFDPKFLQSPDGSSFDMLRVAFAGAYVFSVQMIMRRYFQGDLRASAYLSSTIRVVVALSLVFVINQLWQTDWGTGLKLATGFVVGIFPLVGQQWIQKRVSVLLKSRLPALQSNYPLSDLDGLNVWYEARLLEEGIEDMENLVTANFVDVMLHTRVPTGRLVDWINQATLLIHLEPRPEPGNENRGAKRVLPVRETHGQTHETLRRLGIRTATDLEDVLRPLRVYQGVTVTNGVSSLVERQQDLVLRQQVAKVLSDSDDSKLDRVLCVLKAFESEPNLQLIRNWKQDWQSENDEDEDSDGRLPSTADVPGRNGDLQRRPWRNRGPLGRWSRATSHSSYSNQATAQ